MVEITVYRDKGCPLHRKCENTVWISFSPVDGAWEPPVAVEDSCGCHHWRQSSLRGYDINIAVQMDIPGHLIPEPGKSTKMMAGISVIDVLD